MRATKKGEKWKTGPSDGAQHLSLSVQEKKRGRRINKSSGKRVWAFAFAELLEITRVAVRGAGLPAFPKHANPFESQGAEDDLMGFSFGHHMLVIGAGPRAVDDGLPGPFHKSL